jgi:hypothetical protein
MTGRTLRGLAMLIALAGVIDPVVTSHEPVRPVIALSAAGAADDTARRVRAELGGRFHAAPGPVADAAAIVAVGGVPERRPSAAGIPRVLVVDDTPRVVVSRLDVPARALAGEQVPIALALRTIGTDLPPAITVEVLAGEAVVERRTIDAATLRPAAVFADETAFSFVPAGPGSHRVRVVARAGAAESAADALVTVVDRRWRVLVHDARPAWPSTFVRRAIEGDVRFDVAARVATSRRADAASGQPPATLVAPEALDAYDVIVVGVPDMLTARETAALERFMRERGGTVVFLLDRMPAGAMAGVTAWTERLHEDPVTLLDGRGAAALEASEVALPRELPPGAQPLATVAGSAADAPVWQQPVGAGRLIVSGALDAWRYRASAASEFDGFWRAAMADAASRAPDPVGLEVQPGVARPGTGVRVSLALRPHLSGELTSEAGPVKAWLDAAGVRTPVRLWPVGPGRFEATFVAPGAPCACRVGVATPAGESSADLLVAVDASTVAPDDDRLAAWATAHGGAVVLLSTIGDRRAGLVAALDAVVAPRSNTRLWHPMRSAWWIAPFACLLGADWWRRRRLLTPAGADL